MSQFNKTGGRYGLHSGSAKFKHLQVDGELLAKGSFVYGAAGNVYYVDTDVTASGDGRTPKYAFKTIAEAISAASNDDTILILPGSYTPAAGITITQNNLRILGCPLMGGLQGGGCDITAPASADLITINAHHVEIAGLMLVGVSTNDIIVTGGSKFGIHIHDCRFDTGVYGVDANAEAPNLIVENCYFQTCSIAAIRANSTRDFYRANVIKIPSGGIGIEYVPNAGDRPGIGIFDNYIFGEDVSNGVGIKITGSPTAGTVMIAGNYISNCSTMITAAKGDHLFVENYTSNATGGVRFDPSP